MNKAITIGMDSGDKFHIAVVFDSEGNELEIATVTNTKIGINKFFKSYKSATVPIPSTISLLFIGLLGLIGAGRRNK